MKRNIITVSGPSAVGKSFFVNEVTKKFHNVIETVGLTTRPIRNGEINGKSGIFITKEEMNELEKNEKVVLVKEFFENKYAWYKDDLVNDDTYRIINISYKSIKELREMGLNIYSIFIKPESDELLIEFLKKRSSTNEEFEKRLYGYYESKKFVEEHYEMFDLVFVNKYDDKSLENFLLHIEKNFIYNLDNELACNLNIDKTNEREKQLVFKYRRNDSI